MGILIINVETKDIEQAEAALNAGAPRIACCPIAQAVRRQFPVGIIRVGGVLMLNGTRYTLPPEAHLWIRDFDNARHVTPFSFVAVAR